MRTWVLRTLIASIALSAAAAIVALLSPEFGTVQEKTLFTALTFSAVSLNAMACATAWEQRRRVAYAPAWGIGLSYVVFAMIAAAVWAEIDNETFFRLTATPAVVALVAAHASLLRRTPLTDEAERIAFAAIGTGVVFAGLILVRVWSGSAPGDLELRVLGLFGVLFAATTIAAPVVHLLTRGHAETLPERRAEAPGFCPRCGARLDDASGAGECRVCGARFRVEFHG
jgi:hypothetical protein